MIRVDAAIPPASHPTPGSAEQRPMAAVAGTRALQGDAQAGPKDEHLAKMKEAADALAQKAGRKSVFVDLSGAGKVMAMGVGPAGRAKSNADIDESDLPDSVKALLKRIRELREELRERQAELRDAMADTKMRPDQRKTKVALLQAQIMALSAALVGASTALGKLTRELKLSQEQSMDAGRLMLT
ncbi:MAG TPA: hypothetical protein VL003_01290 [Pusillimonas sp.]|uniref:hypothetical protein n=1 Tax=Pusillimonas sp. TaxID=3040095 RepID=UPI002CA80FD6|nr:hypothetical protein [Pusillimonas sp.]HUH86671.1 hypothetical protein [Pusillimonas sp.]